MDYKKHSLYIGRFQPFHDGHEWCVRKILQDGKRVCIAVMDIHSFEPENNPFPTQVVIDVITVRFGSEIEAGEIVVLKIPPIESVNYTSDADYNIVEHVPPESIRKISATNIRQASKLSSKLKN
tara:strand:- start:68 stop:439 length:372 start_codon:yes stop_codon:yes gene_type:complete